MPSKPFERKEIVFRNWFNEKLSKYELRTRYLLRKYMVRVGAIITFTSLAIFSLIQSTLPVGVRAPPYLLVFIVLGVIIAFIGRLLISDIETALLHFTRFREEKLFEELKQGLKIYNKSVGFIDSKKLQVFVQYAAYAYRLHLHNAIYSFESKMNRIISAIENRDFAEIPKALNEISEESDKFLKEFKHLGVQFRASKWSTLIEITVSSFREIFPKVLWLILLIGVFLIVSRFVPIDLSLPV